MRRDRVIRPGRRKPRVSARPSAASVEFPLADYIIPPSDAKGRSSSTSISLPPAVVRAASAIIERKTLPFETQQDIFRFAIFHGLQALIKMEQDEQITGDWAQIMNWRRANSRLLEAIVYKEELERTFKVINKLADDGHWEQAIQHAEMTWMNADKLEDPYWRDTYRKQARAMLDRMKGRMRRRRAEDARNGDGE